MIKIMASHAYVGCAAISENGLENGPVLVEFSDGTVVGGNVAHLAPGQITLSIDGYRTYRGTEIMQKSWLLINESHDRWRVSKRLLNVS